MASQRAWAIIAGVGPGTCIAREFAKTYSVALLARKSANYQPVVDEINSSGGHAVGISTDTTDSANVKSSFEKLKEVMAGAPLAAAVYNVGGGMVRKPLTELSDDELEGGWATNGRGGILFSRAVVPLLRSQAQSKPEHPPTLIFTGATAAMKGGAQLATFASGKFAMRAVAQSLAREFGPQGIHVVHAIIDGVIDIEKSKGYLADQPDAKISPEAIADTYWFLHTQPRSCFTNELDLRPAIEKW